VPVQVDLIPLRAAERVGKTDPDKPFGQIAFVAAGRGKTRTAQASNRGADIRVRNQDIHIHGRAQSGVAVLGEDHRGALEEHDRDSIFAQSPGGLGRIPQEDLIPRPRVPVDALQFPHPGIAYFPGSKPVEKERQQAEGARRKALQVGRLPPADPGFPPAVIRENNRPKQIPHLLFRPPGQHPRVFGHAFSQGPGIEFSFCRMD
jgi:hypothetical protein